MSEVNELVEFDKIAAGIADIQEKGNFLPDTSTKEGYEASKRFVLDVTTPTRTKLDKAHKKAKAYWVAGGKNVDGKKNEIMDLLVEIQKPHQDAYKAFDQAEKDKKAKFEADIQDKIMVIYNYRILPPNSNSETISEMIQQCGETDTQEGFYHLAKEAASARAESLQVLNELLLGAVSHEAEQKRQAELAEENRLRQIEIDKQQEVMRLQQEEMDRKQAEFERVANEAAAKERKIEEEKQRLIDEANAAEKEKQQAIEREEYARQQAEKAAEQARQAEIQRQAEQVAAEKAAAEKREANKRHNAKVHNAILSVLIDNGISEENGKTMITLAANSQLPQLTINY